MNSSESLLVRRGRPTARDERGQVVLLVALAVFAIVGVAALAIDASFMYDKRNRLYAAADAAAKSAAMEVRRGNFSSGNLWAFARREVGALGFDTAVVQQVNCPPTSGPYTGGVCGTTSSYVEVIVGESTSTFFAGVLSFVSMTPRARAVAGTIASSDCLVTLGTSGLGVNLGENAAITASNCNLAVNSTSNPAINLDNNATLTARSIAVVGGYEAGHATITPTPQTGVPPSSDPLAGLAAPTPVLPCTTNSVTPGDPYSVSGTVTLSAGTYCGFDLGINATLNLNPGVYVITEDFGINLSNNSTINGMGGVLIYNMTGPFFMDNNTHFNIVGPTTGTWAGIAFFQASGNTRTVNVSNNGVYNVSGVTYAPSAQFRVSNNAVLSGACMVIVALSVDIANNGGVLAEDCSGFGGNPLRSVAIAE